MTLCEQVRRLTSCNNMSWRHIAATNRFVCTGEIFWKSLSLQWNFVAATTRINSVWFDFLQHVAATKLCCRDKDFHKKFSIYTRSDFVAATCRCYMLLQLVAGPVHTAWSVVATCCCNLSPSGYRPLVSPLYETLKVRLWTHRDKLMR